MAIEEWIGTNGECANLPLDKGRESGVEVAFGAGLHDHQFLPERDGRGLRFCRVSLGSRKNLGLSACRSCGRWYKFPRQLKPFRGQLVDQGR